MQELDPFSIAAAIAAIIIVILCIFYSLPWRRNKSLRNKRYIIWYFALSIILTIIILSIPVIIAIIQHQSILSSSIFNFFYMILISGISYLMHPDQAYYGYIYDVNEFLQINSFLFVVSLTFLLASFFVKFILKYKSIKF